MTALGGVYGTVCNTQQYEQSQQFRQNTSYGGPSISCLTRGESIGLVVSILSHLSLVLNSYNLQLTAEASIISSISIIVVFSWIGVRSISFRMSPLFDEMLHSGTYGGIGRCFQRADGSYSRGRLMFIWSACPFFCCYSLSSLKFHDSSHFSYSTLFKQVAVCSISGGLTKGSSRQGTIARHKALLNRLVISESP